MDIANTFPLTLSLQPLFDTLKDTLFFPPPSTPSSCPFHHSKCEMEGLLHILAFLCYTFHDFSHSPSIVSHPLLAACPHFLSVCAWFWVAYLRVTFFG
jgi:hypothetical protein